MPTLEPDMSGFPVDAAILMFTSWLYVVAVLVAKTAYVSLKFNGR